jgi:hypothetical protein
MKVEIKDFKEREMKTKEQIQNEIELRDYYENLLIEIDAILESNEIIFKIIESTGFETSSTQEKLSEFLDINEKWTTKLEFEIGKNKPLYWKIQLNFPPDLNKYKNYGKGINYLLGNKDHFEKRLYRNTKIMRTCKTVIENQLNEIE